MREVLRNTTGSTALLPVNAAALVFLFLVTAAFSCSGGPEAGLPEPVRDRFGAITGFEDNREVYLFFSAHDHFEGMGIVMDALGRHGVKASFFLTGECLRDPSNRGVIEGIVSAGHYLGPHSDAHLLYVPWDVGPERDSLLVTRKEFEEDLRKNIAALEPFGIVPGDVKWFLTPYEWYNSEIVEWTNEMGMEVVNFTPGIGTNADYTTPSMDNYRTSRQILQRLWEYEAEQGLGGKILLIHPGIGPERPDPLYYHLYDIIAIIKAKGYQIGSLPGN